MDFPINLMDDTPVETGDERINKFALPYLGDPDAWKQFSDMEVYQADKLMREWIDSMQEVPGWRGNRTNRRFMFSQIFEFLYGRKWDCKKDKKLQVRLQRLFAYYCTTMSNSYYDRITGKTKSKTTYYIRRSIDDYPPYSLRLRLEWLESKGVMPSASNMRLPKDDLKAGHSRYPKTEENMERRREEGRRRFNEYQRERRARIKAEEQEDELE